MNLKSPSIGIDLTIPKVGSSFQIAHPSKIKTLKHSRQNSSRKIDRTVLRRINNNKQPFGVKNKATRLGNSVTRLRIPPMKSGKNSFILRKQKVHSQTTRPRYENYGTNRDEDNDSVWKEHISQKLRIEEARLRRRKEMDKRRTLSLNRTKRPMKNPGDFKLDPETFRLMTGKNWKKKIHLQVDAAENEFVDMTYRHEEYRENLIQKEMNSKLGNHEMASKLEDHKNLEVAISNILGHESVEHLINILKSGDSKFKINEISVGDTLIDNNAQKVLDTVELTASYMRSLIDEIPSLNKKMKDAHIMIQKMVQRTLIVATNDLKNFVKGCYEYHNEVRFLFINDF